MILIQFYYLDQFLVAQNCDCIDFLRDSCLSKLPMPVSFYVKVLAAELSTLC